MRYQAKPLNVCRETKPRNAFTTTIAERNDTTNPTAKTGASPTDKVSRLLNRSYPVAANMTGIARKKENSVAARRERPRLRAPMIVAPDRETPGNSDNT